MSESIFFVSSSANCLNEAMEALLRMASRKHHLVKVSMQTQMYPSVSCASFSSSSPSGTSQFLSYPSPLHHSCRLSYIYKQGCGSALVRFTVNSNTGAARLQVSCAQVSNIMRTWHAKADKWSWKTRLAMQTCWVTFQQIDALQVKYLLMASAVICCPNWWALAFPEL